MTLHYRLPQVTLEGMPVSLPTALIADPLSKKHLTGGGHPERPDRFDAVLESLKRSSFFGRLAPLEARDATHDEIALCHTASYIKTVERDVESGTGELSTGDTVVSAKSLDVAVRAVGSVLNAVDAVSGKKAKNAFCVVRPPGHHATPSRGMGFCIFNSIAIGGRYAQRKLGLERVMIVNWDVHHGNGTQDIFYRDGSVFFFSTHQYPWYPGTGAAAETGEGAGKGTTLNCPFPAGSGFKEIGGAFRHELMSAAEKFRPDLIMVSAGFDSRMADPLGRFTLSDADFAELTRVVLEIADKHSGGRLVSVLEGGYNLSGLGSAAAAHVGALENA
jgi:acetoin utilization deacetylase AcuC-like enzyme